MIRSAAAALALSLAAAAALAAPTEGFRGSYGFYVDVPEGYSSASGMKGEAEVALFYPEKCMSMTLGQCYKAGLVELVVIPTTLAQREAGIKNFDGYIDAMVAEAAKAGMTPTATKSRSAGMPSAEIVLSGQAEAMDAMTMLEGSSVYYRFKYHHSAGARILEAMVGSLRDGR